MANSDGGTVVLRNFAQLSERYRKAIILKSEGKTYSTIARLLQSEFEVPCSRNTVNQWFASGGLLEQANSEYTDQIANYSIKIAQQAIKRASETAVDTLIKLMGEEYKPNIRLNAAKVIANKCIPDGQVTESFIPFDDELPPELVEAANDIISNSKGLSSISVQQ